MNKEYRSMNKELSIQSEYETNYSEKSTRLRQLLENAIVTGDLEMFHQVRNEAELVKDLKVIFEEEVDIQKLYIASILTSFIETAIKQGMPKDVAEITKRKYYTRIAQCTSSGELERYYFQFVKELVMAMKHYSMRQYSSMVKKAIEYIHNNKFQFLYSKDVSNAINVNRSYLSKKFKMETGKTITDYIHKVKLEYGIQMMESNFYKFNEIAELLGYRNYAYFSKVFKKFYKVTPNNFLKNL
ncbi:helix-turn-helix domain-containing protein [Litchfieldia alkalitelluris]|uniref:helix-turn-helix domain-containing protein n=1 Tax=Litchfieldia alkalitelluris TaxID=304268 RepID=UPI0009977631|nr:helix-turn-helix domain-containing protein [Litchfieldia alkalitelluris]